MPFFQRFVTTVTYVVNFLSFSGFQDLRNHDQTPLLSRPDHVQQLEPSYSSGPIFKPPTGKDDDQPGGDFVCDYSAMGKEWSPCSTSDDRGCWLKNNKTGAQFNIHTVYEDPDNLPIGIDRYYTLNITDGSINADGIVFTEGKFFWNVSDPASWDPENRYPGPWVQACWGDTVHVNVVNDMQFNGTTIHWHGIRQLNSTDMDGVPGITQCPIAPGDSFNYTWTARQYGSSWYHSHYALQYADGALGPLTIHGPTSDDWDEPKHPILMTDWGHNSAFQAIWTELANQSTLLNGRGNVTRYNNTVQNQTEIPQPFNLTVSSPPSGGRAKRYLLQLINTSFESIFIFSIDNHNLTVMSSDFVPVEPYNTTNVTIGIGQRYEVVLIAEPWNSTAKSFWMRAYRPNCFKANNDDPPSPGYEKAGLIFYDDETALPARNVTGWAVNTSNCTDEPWGNLHPVVPWKVGNPVKEEKDLAVNLKQDPGIFPLALFSIGGESFNPLQIDYSNPTILNLDYTGQWNPRWVVYPENYNDTSWVYLLLQGSVDPTDPSQRNTIGAHPIHLHGHDFAILQQAYNQTYPAGLNPKFDNPPRRDVVLLPVNGYVLIAFRTDNPGAWLMHCHIAQHASFGLALQVLERQQNASANAQSRGAVVRAQRTCNRWNEWWGDCNNWWYDTDPASGQRRGQYCDFGEQAFSPDSGI